MPYGPEQKYEIALPQPSKFLTPAVVTLILTMIFGFVLLSYWEKWTLRVLALDPIGGILGGREWQLVTYLFVDGGYSLIWNCVCVLVVGSALEREWGTKSFVALWFAVGILCALVWVAISIIAVLLKHPAHLGVTADSSVYGILGAFGLAFRRKRFLFFFWGMEAQYIVLLLIAIGVVLAIPQPWNWIWVAGAGVGYLYVTLIWKLREGFSIGGGKPQERARFKDLG